MTFFDTVKGTVNTAVDTISSVTQSFVEKNRTNAKLNRLRLVMKNESELMNRAYIALGKKYYEDAKKGKNDILEQEQKLFEVIDKSKARIAKARKCYRDIVDSTNDIFYSKEDTEVSAPQPVNTDDIVDITVACSNEGDYESKSFYEQKSGKNLEIKKENEAAKQKALEEAQKITHIKHNEAKAPKLSDEDKTDGEVQKEIMLDNIVQKSNEVRHDAAEKISDVVAKASTITTQKTSEVKDAVIKAKDSIIAKLKDTKNAIPNDTADEKSVTPTKEDIYLNSENCDSPFDRIQTDEQEDKTEENIDKIKEMNQMLSQKFYDDSNKKDESQDNESANTEQF